MVNLTTNKLLNFGSDNVKTNGSTFENAGNMSVTTNVGNNKSGLINHNYGAANDYKKQISIEDDISNVNYSLKDP